MFEAVLTRSDGEEDAKVTGPTRAILAYVDGIDWHGAAGGQADPFGDMPSLVIRRTSDGDLLALEFDAPKELFQCTTIVTVPGKLFGISSYFWSDTWESDAIWLGKNSVREAALAFCEKKIEVLRRLWQPT